MIRKPGGVKVSKKDRLDHNLCKVCVSGHPEATKMQKIRRGARRLSTPHSGMQTLSLSGLSNVLVE